MGILFTMAGCNRGREDHFGTEVRKAPWLLRSSSVGTVNAFPFTLRGSAVIMPVDVGPIFPRSVACRGRPAKMGGRCSRKPLRPQGSWSRRFSEVLRSRLMTWTSWWWFEVFCDQLVGRFKVNLRIAEVGRRVRITLAGVEEFRRHGRGL